MESLVTDTHPFVWFATGQIRKLGRKSRAAFEAVDAGKALLFVPGVVVLETWWLGLSGVLGFGSSLSSWWARFEVRPNFVVEPILIQDIYVAAELDWNHRDTMDRILVAAALRLGVPLASNDSEIASWGGVPLLW